MLLQRQVAVVAPVNAETADPETATQRVRRVRMADLVTATTVVGALEIALRSKTAAPVWVTPHFAHSAMPWSMRSWP